MPVPRRHRHQISLCVEASAPACEQRAQENGNYCLFSRRDSDEREGERKNERGRKQGKRKRLCDVVERAVQIGSPAASLSSPDGTNRQIYSCLLMMSLPCQQVPVPTCLPSSSC